MIGLDPHIVLIGTYQAPNRKPWPNRPTSTLFLVWALRRGQLRFVCQYHNRLTLPDSAQQPGTGDLMEQHGHAGLQSTPDMQGRNKLSYMRP
jgi:hypothetical protein